ncbi:hypothetical protein OJJOAM_003808 [Cupriavidus sp. H18C1]
MHRVAIYIAKITVQQVRTRKTLAKKRDYRNTNMTFDDISLGAIVADMRMAERPLMPAEQAYLAELRQRIAAGSENLWAILEDAGMPSNGGRLSGDVMLALTMVAQSKPQ